MASVQQQHQSEALDGTAGIERTSFPTADALYKICGMVSFHEFLRLRLVCTGWENIVLSHPRIQMIQVRLGKTYRNEGEHMEMEQKRRGASFTWTAVHFQHFFCPNSTEPFSRNWDRISNHVTKLELERITVACNDLLEFLKRCPALEDLKFHRILFKSCKRESTTVQVRPGVQQLATVTARCVHPNWIPDPNEILIPPRIRSLHLLKFDFFPLCILDYVASRCRGTLQHLKYCEARYSWKRYLHLPSMQDIENRLFTVFIQSAATLETFKMSQVYRGDLLLRRIINADTAAQPGGVIRSDQLQLRLREIDLEQCYAWSASLDRNVTHAFPDFLNQFAGPQVEGVGIRLVHHVDMDHLRRALLRLTNLRRLSIRNNWGDNTIDIGPLIHLMPNLADLHIKDRRHDRQPYILPGYALNLPASVTKFEFSHRHMPLTTYTAICNSPRGAAFTKLMVGFGKPFTDDMMQAAIAHFPNLREFEVSDSKKLTDSGVTGLSVATCNALLSTNSYRLMLTQTARPSNRSISELKYLTRLSFDGCRKISDVTLLVAIRFPNLRFLNMSFCLNVTDVGLANIHTHNPGIESLSIRKCKKISHFGINELVKNCPTIVNVHTSRGVIKRKLGNVKYEEHPDFSKVVTLARWDEKIVYRNL